MLKLTQEKKSMKRCSRCKLMLPSDYFGKNVAHKDGLNNECKTCAKVSQQKSIKGSAIKNAPLAKIKAACRKFANNTDPAIQDVLDLAKEINLFIDDQELE